MPGAITIVVFEAMEATAFCSCATVDTLTIVPVGGGSGTGGNAGPATAAVGIVSISASKPAFETMSSGASKAPATWRAFWSWSG